MGLFPDFSSGDFGRMLDELFGFGDSSVTVPAAGAGDSAPAREEGTSFLEGRQASTPPSASASAKRLGSSAQKPARPAAKKKPSAAKAKPAAKTVSPKPIQVERQQTSTGKKINGKEMIIYSAIMNPKFDE